ncbi:hypothetical protein [Burkholderia arboris]|uniref:Uncharacterized protein n=1 Tax=Burkholderia arboris TaxID=488730 RepID=A0ABZ3DM85_9BURK|nr:hypothetical protein [Burkholderia arboris]UTV57279.1 hypothetical protein NLX30_29755 [Burkholderia arboris]
MTTARFTIDPFLSHAGEATVTQRIRSDHFVKITRKFHAPSLIQLQPGRNNESVMRRQFMSDNLDFGHVIFVCSIHIQRRICTIRHATNARFELRATPNLSFHASNK